MNVCNPILCFCFAFKVHAPHSKAKGGQGEWTGFPRRGPSSSGPVSRVVVVPFSSCAAEAERYAGNVCRGAEVFLRAQKRDLSTTRMGRKTRSFFRFRISGRSKTRRSRRLKILKSPASPTFSLLLKRKAIETRFLFLDPSTEKRRHFFPFASSKIRFQTWTILCEKSFACTKKRKMPPCLKNNTRAKINWKMCQRGGLENRHCKTC